MFRSRQRTRGRGSGVDFLAGATLDLNFASGQYFGALPSDLTFTRALAAYGETREGGLVLFGSGVPRITNRGLLVEDPRTNYLRRSQEFGAADWTAFQAGVTPDAAVALDGTTTADSIVEDSTTNSHGVEQTVSQASNLVYTTAFFAKAGSRSWLRLMIDDAGGVNFVNAWFNLAAGAVGTVGSGGTGSGASARMEQMADGWWRCVLTGTPASSSTGSTRVLVRVATGDGVTSYAGNGTGNILVWGAQLEQAPNPTSYIPTVAIALNRPADLASLAGANFTRWYTNSAAFTWFVQARMRNDNPGPNTQRLLQVSQGTSSLERYLVGVNSAENVRTIVTSGGSNTVDISVAVTVTGVNAPSFKAASAFAANDCALVLNGGAPVPDTVATMAAGVDNVTIGAGAADACNGFIERIAYLPFRAANAELQRLTA